MAHAVPSFETVRLGEIDSARSRHLWTRSGVLVGDDLVVVGRWNGGVTALDRESIDIEWEFDHVDSAVTLAATDGSIVVGGRGPSGRIASYDPDTGDERWSYATATDVGEPSAESVFCRPYVVDVVADGDRSFAAARRYERDRDARRWDSAVYAFDRDGTVRWRYSTDASPISVDLDDRGDRLAVGYNRCAGDHDDGLVILDAESGRVEWTWDPGTAGDRRVGDVSFGEECLAVSSHGDKRGYLLGADGSELWRADLATETEVGAETLYAYPNHAHATEGRVTFVTGNTYAEEGRETDGRHPNEHRIVTFDTEGRTLWSAILGGFAHELAADGDRLVVPVAQNFRTRDPATHALRWFDLASGDGGVEHLDGIATAADVDGDLVAAIQEPVEYHDEGTVRGEYALLAGALQG
ncbi:PQQ-binding-like beta-propeller repeat protein [Halomarina halobia]|uniref:PQQ-binding-like beta-propeller repeat protein n=1 Tax=Halomarina halobia TaxID=3033386 RepID=A0ABD6A4S8_9EURY|nr:PQQ-binding-like beta-propeller repeat protein [Halomarina sp. PSR21]